MGTTTLYSRRHTLTTMKLAIFLAPLVGIALANKGLKCVRPAMETKPATYKKHEHPAVDMEDLKARITAINDERRAAIPEAKILTFEEIAAKYGDDLVEKLKGL